MSPLRKLSREDWIRAAYRELEKGGVEAVRVDPLSRALGATRGSFYWHFRDRAELLDELVNQWSSRSRGFRSAAQTARTSSARLERLAEVFATSGGHRADRAVMRWAQHDSRVAARAGEVLRRRLDYLAGLLHEHGLPDEESRWRAQAISYAYMGWLDRVDVDRLPPRTVRDWTRRLIQLALAPAVRPRRRAPRRSSPERKR